MAFALSVAIGWCLRKLNMLLALTLSVIIPNLMIFLYIELSPFIYGDSLYQNTAPLQSVAYYTLGIPSVLFIIGSYAFLRKNKNG